MEARKIFLVALAGALAALALVKADLRSVVEHFYEQQGERKFLKVYGDQASAVTYEECRANAVSCLGKVVAWPIWHPAKGLSYVDNPSQPLRWSNEDQVPLQYARAGPTTAICSVRAVHPDAIELVFLGSPQAGYGGTTRKERGSTP